GELIGTDTAKRLKSQRIYYGLAGQVRDVDEVSVLLRRRPGIGRQAHMNEAVKPVARGGRRVAGDDAESKISISRPDPICEGERAEFELRCGTEIRRGGSVENQRVFGRALDAERQLVDGIASRIPTDWHVCGAHDGGAPSIGTGRDRRRWRANDPA